MSCQNKQPDFSWDKKSIITKEVYRSTGQLTLPDSWEVRFDATSKGPEGRKRIYFNDEFVISYETYIPIQEDKKDFITVRRDTVFKKTPTIVELMRNNQFQILNVYEWEKDEKYPYHFFKGSSKYINNDDPPIIKLYEILLDNCKSGN